MQDLGDKLRICAIAGSSSLRSKAPSLHNPIYTARLSPITRNRYMTNYYLYGFGSWKDTLGPSLSSLCIDVVLNIPNPGVLWNPGARFP